MGRLKWENLPFEPFYITMSLMIGKIDYSKLKVKPEQHEIETARFFSERGCDVSFIPPSNSPKVHTPDIMMCGIAWEIKSPTGKSKRTIENCIRQAAKQSHYIIIDLRRVKLEDRICLLQIKRQFNLKTYIKRILVITKSLELVELSRK